MVGRGTRGALAAIPSNGSDLLFRPSKAATGIVAGALALAGWFVLWRSHRTITIPGVVVHRVCQMGYRIVQSAVSIYRGQLTVYHRYGDGRSEVILKLWLYM